jgi:hypothetical protein
MRDARSSAELAEVEKSLEPRGGGGAETRRVGGRLFRLADGVWTEAPTPDGVSPARVVEIALYSAAYFDLLGALPELVPIVSALERVEVRGEGVTLRLAGGGRESLSADELAALARGFRERGVPAPAAPGQPREESR